MGTVNGIQVLFPCRDMKEVAPQLLPYLSLLLSHTHSLKFLLEVSKLEQ